MNLSERLGNLSAFLGEAQELSEAKNDDTEVLEEGVRAPHPQADEEKWQQHLRRTNAGDVQILHRFLTNEHVNQHGVIRLNSLGWLKGRQLTESGREACRRLGIKEE
jgi:hypothetical protein